MLATRLYATPSEFLLRTGGIQYVLHCAVVVAVVGELVHHRRLLHLAVEAFVFVLGSLTLSGLYRFRRYKLGYGTFTHTASQGRRDSNPQPPVLETGALPIEPLP